MSETESDIEKNMRSPEGKFTGDYANEFLGFEFSLKDLKYGHISADNFYKNNQNRLARQGKLILKFSERYKDMPIPQMYAEKIKELDDMADQINTLFNTFLESKDDKEKDDLRDELIKLTEKATRIIKS